MNYFEEELIFTAEKPTKALSRNPNDKHSINDVSEVLGIKIRLGNRPLVYNLKDLCDRAGKRAIPSRQDHYLIVHTIGAIRTQGKARVDELQYLAVAVQPDGLQTVDLIPKTRFNEIIKADL